MTQRKKKSDWFSIVATDLFCGALCAVIVLDACLPKLESANPKLEKITLAYPVSSTGACRGSDVAFAFEIAGTTYSTLEGPIPTAIEVDTTCRVSVLTAVPEGDVEGARILIGYASLDFDAEASIPSKGTFRCISASGKCQAN